MALDNLTGQNIQDTYQRVVQTENGAFADGTGSAINIITSNQTGSFVTNFDTGSFVTNSDTGSFVITNSDVLFSNITASANISASGTGSFNHLEIAANATINGVLSIPGLSDVSASVAAALAGGDDLGNHTATQTLNLNSNKIIGVTSISASGEISGSNLSGINTGDQDLSTYIQNSQTASFVTNSQTASFVTNSQTASFLVPSDTASFLVPSDTASFLVPSDTASFAITSSDVKFSNITASGDISASGLLYISASETSATNYKILVQNSADGRIYTTGSVAGGEGISSFTNIASDVTPDGDGTRDLGSPTAKWDALYAVDTFFGGIHEINLETTGIGQLQTGTVLVSKAGQMVPCDAQADALVMGIVTSGSDYPVIMGAEPVLVDGPVYEGDYIITSNRLGYGKAVPPDQIFEQRLFGKIIAQSLETNINGGVIKAMIRKM